MSVKQALDDFGFDVVEGAKTILKQKDKNTSKKLSNSLDYKIKVSKNSFEFTLYMEDYGQYIDRGVKGAGGTKADGSKWQKKRIANNSLFKQRAGYKNKRPPANVFLGWIKKRGVQGRNKKTGRFTTRKSLSFAIANSVFHTGIEATRFLSTPVNKYFKKLPQDIVEAYGLTVDSLLKNSLKSID